MPASLPPPARTTGGHVELDTLADDAEELLDEEQSRAVRAHLNGCAECRTLADSLAAVTPALVSAPNPSMPPIVAARLARVLEAESRQRTSRPAPPVGLLPRPTLGTFEEQWVRRRKNTILLPALVAATAATAVGFGGYVLSASSGLNEPVATSPAYVSEARLGSEASSLRDDGDLSAHRFSRAWKCARAVTKGRITDIASVVMDGRPALFVYTKRSGQTLVTVVTGCDSEPSAGPSTTLPR